MKTKILIFLVSLLALCSSFGLVPEGAQAQKTQLELLDSLIAGDTISTQNFGVIYDEGIVTASDSSNSTTDSMKCYAETYTGSGVWIIYGLKNIASGSIETILVPGDGAAKGWTFDGPVPPSLKFVLTNATYSTLRKLKLGFLLKRSPPY